MTKTRTLLALAVALGIQTGVGAATTIAAETCPNAEIRSQQNVTGLPDCRAYELVTSDSNHASGAGIPGGWLSEDGKRFFYQLIDAPDNANGSNIANVVVAKRDPFTGWSGESLVPPLTLPPTVYMGAFTTGLSRDLTSIVVASDEPLSGGAVPSGGNLYVSRPDGTFWLVDNVGYPILAGFESHAWDSILEGGTPSFSNIYYRRETPELSGVQASALYASSESAGVRVVSVLPEGASVGPATLTSYSVHIPGLSLVPSDGAHVPFVYAGHLYLRVNDERTLDLQATGMEATNDASERAGITEAGDAVFVTSRAELTSDANTGPANEGRDLYRYDTASERYTDLTPDANPSDIAGANVLNVNEATPDGSYVYFTATGVLAGGAIAGLPNLYVWHEGHVSLVIAGATADGGMYLSADNQHDVLVSRAPLTGYDNSDAVTGRPHFEVFEFTPGSSFVCVSCRGDGTRPTGDSTLPGSAGLGEGDIRIVSQDGRRVFFVSKDAVLPQASNGHQQVFEYTNGKVYAISRPNGEFESQFLTASPSGDDVFFNSWEGLIPNAADEYSIYDARVDGGIPVAPQRCMGAECQAPVTAAPELPVAASVNFSGDTGVAGGDAKQVLKVIVSKVATIKGRAGALRISVPTQGRLTVSGAGLATKRTNVSKAQAVTVGLRLTGIASRRLERHGVYRTRVRVTLSSSADSVASTSFVVTFKAATIRKGR